MRPLISYEVAQFPEDILVRRSRTAFTLIELLIVVAIIGILAAIAVPNFMNARIRAKISRVQADQKQYAQALELYFLDNGAYPWTDALPYDNTILENRWVPLTTPVAYMNAVPQDPFGDPTRKVSTSTVYETYRTYDSWIAKPGMSHFGWLERVGEFIGVDPKQLRYAFASQGPDLKPWAETGGALLYDASNGLVSLGDIYRAGPGQMGGMYK